MAQDLEEGSGGHMADPPLKKDLAAVKVVGLGMVSRKKTRGGQEMFFFFG